MNVDFLRKLNESVEVLLQQRNVSETIQGLKESLLHTDEAFVWSSVDIAPLRDKLPEDIKSGWIFVLRKNVRSEAHYHPNSIQHMVMIEGQGKAEIAEVSKRMIPFGAPDRSLDEIWYVIGQGVPHEFFPEERNMVVISFHTCEPNELEEVTYRTGESRLYEGENNRRE